MVVFLELFCQSQKVQAKNIISLSFSPCLGRLRHGQKHVHFILFHSSRHKYIYVYIYIHIYIHIYLYQHMLYFSSFFLVPWPRSSRGERVFGWLCFILVKSCFNSQDMHLRLQLFHVLFYQIMVNQATNSSNLVYNFCNIIFQLFPPFLHSFGRPPLACGAHIVGF